MSDALPALPDFDTRQFELVTLIDGREGRNRARNGVPQIAAEDDLGAIQEWLYTFADSPRTFATYRKEAERLWLWSTQILRAPVSSLTHRDMVAYRAFITAPPPAWINPKRAHRGHPEWRPFAGPLSKASARQAEIIVNALFSWLVNAGWLAGNPLSLSRNRRRKTGATPHTQRYLTLGQWRRVLLATDRLPADTPDQRLRQARARWLTRLLYLTGMRISEVVENTMAGFEAREGPDGRTRAFLTVTGKGDKPRDIPVTSELVEELGRYRQALGLPAWPAPGETTPLVQSLRIRAGQTKIGLTRSAVHDVLKGVFAVAVAETPGPEAAKLAQASAHWLRHSRASHLVAEGVALKSIQDLLGHASLATTGIYLHGEDNARHDEIEKADRGRGV